MPTFNAYKEKNGYYIKARPSGAGNITYQTSPTAAELIADLGYDDGDQIPWDVVKPLRLANEIYTEGQGTGDDGPLPATDPAKLSRGDEEQLASLLDRLLSDASLSSAQRHRLRDYADRVGVDVGAIGPELRATERAIRALDEVAFVEFVADVWHRRGYRTEMLADDVTALLASQAAPFPSTHLLLFGSMGDADIGVSTLRDLRSQAGGVDRTFAVQRTSRSRGLLSDQIDLTTVGCRDLAMAALRDEQLLEGLGVDPDRTPDDQSEEATAGRAERATDEIAIDLVAFAERADITDRVFEDDERVVRPVAFFEVHNTSSEVIRWDCGKGMEIVGSDKFRYSGDPDGLVIKTSDFPSTWEKGKQKLRPDVRARGVAFFEALPDGVSAEKLVYTQKLHEGTEATSGIVREKQTFEFALDAVDDALPFDL